MKVFSKIVAIILFTFLLTACGDLKEAVSGIGSAANSAAKATGTDVHAIRAMELSYNGETVTVNDLFKTDLRDVFWKYKETQNGSTLVIKGTWQEPLFESYGFDTSLKNKLAEDGDVIVTLHVKDHAIIVDKTTVQLIYQKDELVNESGKEVLDYFLKTYAEKVSTSSN